MYYKCHKINLNRGGSYIDSPDCIKNKKVAINSINRKYNKCFQYVVTVALILEEIKKDLQRIIKIKPFINKYNWEAINVSPEKYDWKKFEKNKVTIALNILNVKKKLYPAYVSKHNSNREEQVTFLMIPKGEGWHYLAVKKYADFYCLNCLHFFRTENKLEKHKKVCENKDFCNVSIMPSENIKISEFNQYQKYDKAPFIIYPDLECLTEKIDGCKNNPEHSFTTKAEEDVPSGFSMSTISSFKSIENKHDVYRGKDCMKKFCESLREHAMKIINFLKNEVINKRAAGII